MSNSLVIMASNEDCAGYIVDNSLITEDLIGCTTCMLEEGDDTISTVMMTAFNKFRDRLAKGEFIKQLDASELVVYVKEYNITEVLVLQYII